ncbi:MAG: hypothetical protein K6T85_17720, partial [Gorillibacterium sp.]|nr:hypothetical protein [Gorillibacterium sp.]
MKVEKCVYVKDFAQLGDDAQIIRAAIQHALDIGAASVVFEPVRYLLQSAVTIQTEGFAHDASSSAAGYKDCHIVLQGARSLTLQGAVDEQGEPATILVGYNDEQVHGYLPAILWCEDCDKLSIENIAFTREPEYASAGVVIDKDDSHIVVQVFEGNPCREDKANYCMNRFDPVTGALVGESVTYGDGVEGSWALTGPRQLTLESPDIAAKVQIGEHLSWHQGAKTDFQTYFARCDQLSLTNIRTLNSNGFCMLTEGCRDITASRIVFRPGGNRLFTAPRDAWKLFKCSGKIDISQMIIEGVRMDGQNMHSNWLVLEQVISPKEAIFFCKYTYAPLDIGSTVELYDGEEVYRLQVESWTHQGKGNNGHYYRISFNQELPIELYVG